MIEYQAHWPLQKPICMMTIACLLMLIIHMIQDMHRSENWLALFIPFYPTRHCTADNPNPKVVTVNVTDIFSTLDNVMSF